jgi:hypothetical protein
MPEKLIKVKYVGACAGCGSDQTVVLDMKPEGRKHCPKTYSDLCILCKNDAPPVTFVLSQDP